jgi:hypothetical protein
MLALVMFHVSDGMGVRFLRRVVEVGYVHL